MNCSKETVIRTVLLVLSLVNQILTVLGAFHGPARQRIEFFRSL